MAKIQAAIIQIPQPLPHHTVKAIEAQKLLRKKREAEVSSCLLKLQGFFLEISNEYIMFHHPQRFHLEPGATLHDI